MGVQKAWDGGGGRPTTIKRYCRFNGRPTAVLCALFRDRTGPTAGGSASLVVVAAVHVVMFNIDDDFRENRETSRPDR